MWVFLLSVLTLLGRTHAACNADNCLRTIRASASASAKSANCAAYQTTYSTPYTTVTVHSSVFNASPSRRPTPFIPAYASACTNDAAYRSACSCIGETSTVITVATSTVYTSVSGGASSGTSTSVSSRTSISITTSSRITSTSSTTTSASSMSSRTGATITSSSTTKSSSSSVGTSGSVSSTSSAAPAACTTYALQVVGSVHFPNYYIVTPASLGYQLVLQTTNFSQATSFEYESTNGYLYQLGRMPDKHGVIPAVVVEYDSNQIFLDPYYTDDNNYSALACLDPMTTGFRLRCQFTPPSMDASLNVQFQENPHNYTGSYDNAPEAVAYLSPGNYTRISFTAIPVC